MKETISFALAQINTTVGDISGNIDSFRKARNQAARDGIDVLLTSELAVSGYPPEDLILKKSFLDKIVKEVKSFARETKDGGPAILLGAPWRKKGKIFNAALLLAGGKILGEALKCELPNYGVFDEKRIFSSSSNPTPIKFKSRRLGIMICEDMWNQKVAKCLAEKKADILISINGSPFELGKISERLQLAKARAKENNLPLIYLNQVGGQDELVFDGNSFLLSPNGSKKLHMPPWQESLMYGSWDDSRRCWSIPFKNDHQQSNNDLENIYHALVLGLRDYVQKNNFKGVIIGLSGGMDSALTATIAVDALGEKSVECVMMPSSFTSKTSLLDAKKVSKNLGIQLVNIPIQSTAQSFKRMIERNSKLRVSRNVFDNIQARSRGVTLMSISNANGYLVLSTGNKSETSVGYVTIYGDMCGGYAVLKDIYKTTVYQLAEWRNKNFSDQFSGSQKKIIPSNIFSKAPTAELHPNQKDQDILPPYKQLDGILKGFLEEDMGIRQIVSRGYDRKIVKKVWQMLILAEYKRRQSPPGIKVTKRAFGKDRRYPITNHFFDRP